jgi:hypothetical protein
MAAADASKAAEGKPGTKRPAQTQAGESQEEPEITQEESVPSDGRDLVGDRMIEDLGRQRRTGTEPSPGGR